MLIKRSVLIGCGYLLFSIVVSWMSYFYLREHWLEQSEQHNSSELLNTITNVRSAINKFQALPFLLSKQLDIQSLLTQPNAFHLNRVRRYLEQINLVAGSAALLVLDQSANVAAYSNWRDKNDQQQGPFIDSPFYLQAIKGEHGKGVWVNDQQIAWFYFSAPIYKQSVLIGVAVIQIDIAKTLKELTIRDSFFMLDANDQLIYSNTKQLQNKGLASLHSSDLLLSNGLSLNLVKFEKQQFDLQKSYMLQQVELDDTHWKIGILSPVSATNKALINAIAVLAGCLALGLLAMYLREYRSKKRSQGLVVAAQLESEARGRYIINTAQSGLITLDCQGKITFINPLVKQKFKCELADVIQQPIENLFDFSKQEPTSNKNTDSHLNTDFAQSISNMNIVNRGYKSTVDFTTITNKEVMAKGLDNSLFPVMLSIKQMHDAPVPEYLVTIVDISKRKLLEERLQEMNESLETKVIARTKALQEAQIEIVRSEKMVALGRMSTAIVHELNQPLTAFRNYLAIINKVRNQPEAVAQRLESLHSLVDNMAAITSQLRLFAYSNPRSDKEVRPNEVLQNVIAMHFSLFTGEQIQLELDVSEMAKSAVIRGDSRRLEQVFNNLLKNAVDAMTEHQLIKQKRCLKIKLASDEKQVKLIFSDTGGGVDKAQLMSLFEPFYTTKEIGLGLGLGLSIVKSIVQDLDGEIRVKNINQGLEFSLNFPLSKMTMELS